MESARQPQPLSFIMEPSGPTQALVPKPPTTVQAEFTRRKNWSQSILDELRDVVHVLSPKFKILYCSPASSEFLGYQPTELVNHLFTEYLHVDDADTFSREFRNASAENKPFKAYYRLLRKDGKYTSLETRGHFFKGCFFGLARCVPAQSTRMMDTFLDLKMENEILKRKLVNMKQKQQQQNLESEKSSPITSSSEDRSETADMDDDEFDGDFDEEEFLPNAAHVYTPGVNTSYDMLESVSLFTGLRYDLGERSRGISLGLVGELTTVAQLPPSMPSTINSIERVTVHDEDEETNEQQKRVKKKRIEVEAPKICTDCGTTSAPEWRKGPKGPKTLCNACGLRWAKTSKRPDGSDI
ncbi:GATA-type zinc finger transcription factor [Phycomyces blakesleeanus]|uniref:GATA-type zinc finger transcription factor n=2 Tax=Phycomyces blakesleeanus TaxID=4837 RepID=A0A167PTN4_PHYB8|nr:GATA-type zinc finger transcription factor [Phycomyces blakesleeanus NRRL 1555(-)]OAD78518.1 GATA-type zinc finger transcription factor [Phycomyces blakesleeanus NRRL 1555(-)]CAQ76858.1 MADB protein [Phycomyces blakesleeanus]|eukprot:XP_018296558.1 GATA-type zinc finger transcription factor [Phycomyces blakesleeanus NRRL 1555(-)]